MIVYVKTSSKKKLNKKATKKQLALRESWEKILKKFDTKPSEVFNKANLPTTPIREIKQPQSLKTMAGNCNKVPDKIYTGKLVIGLSTLHKSNIVPVFSKEEAIDHAKMRRG